MFSLKGLWIPISSRILETSKCTESWEILALVPWCMHRQHALFRSLASLAAQGHILSLHQILFSSSCPSLPCTLTFSPKYRLVAIRG